MRPYITLFWFIMMIVSSAVVIIGIMGAVSVLCYGDPDAWLSIGQFINWSGMLFISIVTFLQLRKK